MSNLLLINGFPLETKKEAVKDYLMLTFHEETVQRIWMDPLAMTRAVAMFEKTIDPGKISACKQQRSLKMQSNTLVFEIVASTFSACIQTHGSLKVGAVDKLSLLFSSKRQGGGKVTAVNKLRMENCFEVVFKDGWEVVLSVCEHLWKVENTVLTVYPYFNCFKEHVHDQFRRLLIESQKLESQIKLKDISKESPRAIHTVTQTQNLQKLNPGINSQSTVHHSGGETMKFQNVQSSGSTKKLSDFTKTTKERIELKRSTFFFQDSLLPFLLNLLNFQSALKKQDSNLTIEIDHTELEAEIIGPSALVKLIHKILSREDSKMPFSSQEKQFISSENIQKDVKALITGLEWHFECASPELAMLVVDKDDQKMTFHEFLKSLVITRSCSPLPSEDFKKSEDWVYFIDSFNSTYTHRQIFVSGNSVSLLSLAYKHHDLDFMINLINGKILLATRLEKTKNIEFKKLDYSQENILNRQSLYTKAQNTQVQNTQVSIVPLERSSKTSSEMNEQLSQNAPRSIEKLLKYDSGKKSDLPEGNVKVRLISQGNEETKKKIICKQQYFVWLFYVLNLKAAITDKFKSATVEMSELESAITINGKKDEARLLKDVITLETEQISLTDANEKLLADESFQKQVETLVLQSKWHLVLDGDLSLTMFVKDYADDEISLQSFLSLILSFDNIESIPSESVEGSLQWVSHKDTCSPVQHSSIDAKGSVSFVSTPLPPEDTSFSIINSEFCTWTLDVPEDRHHLMALNADPDGSVMTNPLMREDNHDDKTLDQNSQASDSSSEIKKNLSKFTIICRHQFYVWLLDILDLKSAAMKKYKGLKMELKVDDTEVVISGKGEDAEKVKTLVLSQEEKIVLTDDEEDFLAESNVLQHMKSVVRKAGYCIDINNEWSEGFILTDEENHQTSFQELISSLLVRRHCQPFARASYQNKREWMDFVDSIHSTNPLCRIIVDNKDVTLLTVGEGKDCTTILRNINEFASLLGDSPPQPALPNQDMMKLKEGHDSSPESQDSPNGSSQKVTSKQSLNVRQLAMKFEGKTQDQSDQEFKRPFMKQASADNKTVKEIKVNKGENILEKSPQKEMNKDDILNESKVKVFSVQSEIKTSSSKHRGENILEKSPQKEMNKDDILNEPKVKVFPIQSEIKTSTYKRAPPEIYTFTVHHSSFSRLTSSGERRSYRLMNDKTETGELFYRSKSLEEPLSTHVYSLTPQESACYSMFLHHDLDTLIENHKDYSAHIIYNTDSIEVKATSKKVVDSICEKMEILFKMIQFETQQVCFPGLEHFVETSAGLEFIESISTTCQCFVEFPDEVSLSHDKQLTRPDYRIVSLGTAMCNGFNLHLLIGNIKNSKPQLKVEFSPSKVSECSVKPQGTSSHLVLQFPECFSNQESQMEESFKKSISLVLQQAKYMECASLMFSTALLHDAESGLSFSRLAEIVLDQLLETYKSQNLNFDVNNADVYICEPGSLELLEAFKSVLEKFGLSFGPPDQKSWERISLPDETKVTDYRQMKVKVKVEAQSHQVVDTRTLVCYPVPPNLDTSSCPILQEKFCSVPDLEQSVRKFLINYPEGLSVGDSLQVSCLEGNREALLYACPEWGFDSEMAIHDALEACLLGSSEFEAVHIVPPGLHVQPKYPKKFLTHRVFQILDQLLFEKVIFRQRKIVLVVEDKLYRKAFEKELGKRYSNIDEGKNADIISIKKEGVTKSCTEDTGMLRNKISSSLVSFGAMSGENIKKAAAMLTDRLSHLMASTSVKLALKKDATLLCESLIKQEQGWLVSIFLEKLFLDKTAVEELPKKQKRKRKKSKGTDQKKCLPIVGSTLTIEGLSKMVVDEFKNRLTHKSITYDECGPDQHPQQ